jgi:protein involved in polysaccharide export with SLBB domain
MPSVFGNHPFLFRRLLLQFSLVLSIVACGPVTAQQTGHADSATADAMSANAGYRLGSGDRVRITVYGQPELTGEYAVDGSGALSFPLIGHIRAGGRSAGDLEKALVDRLQPNYLKNPSVSVEILTYRPFYIVGEVRTPGSYPYVSGMTVLNAVALAGGFTYRAREGDFYVMRQTAEGGRGRLQAVSDTPVLPGDVITVRERYF